MRLTERDRLILIKTLTFLPWIGLMVWAGSHSLWLGLAFILYVNLDRLYFSKYWGPQSFSKENS